MRFKSIVRHAAAISLALLSPAAATGAAEIRVMSSAAFKAAYLEPAAESQVWLGRAMQALQQVSVLTGPAVDGDQVRLTLEAVTTEELAHVWALFPNTNYRTSVVYVASPVRIDHQ